MENPNPEAVRIQYRRQKAAGEVENPSSWTTLTYTGVVTPALGLLLGEKDEERIESGKQHLRDGGDAAFVAKTIPLTEETVGLLLEQDPNALSIIIERMWGYRGVNIRGGWPYDEGPLHAIRAHSAAALVAIEVLATWSGHHQEEYWEAVRALDGRADRLETYLTLLADWRTEAGTTKYGVNRYVTTQAANTAAWIHP